LRVYYDIHIFNERGYWIEMNAACRHDYAASVPRSGKLDPRNAGASTRRTKFMGCHTLLLSVSQTRGISCGHAPRARRRQSITKWTASVAHSTNAQAETLPRIISYLIMGFCDQSSLSEPPNFCPQTTFRGPCRQIHGLSSY
jgi:hypothetical protein